MSLYFNVSQLLKSDVGQTREYEFDADHPLDLDGPRALQVAGRVKLTQTKFGILAAGHMHATLELECARCLEKFRAPVDADFEEEYQPVIDIITGLPSSTPRTDEIFFISPNHVLDLEEPVRQQLLTSIPMIPVCRDDCLGLCPTCGVNRNSEQCACPPPESSSPFAVLQGLLSESAHE